MDSSPTTPVANRALSNGLNRSLNGSGIDGETANGGSMNGGGVANHQMSYSGHSGSAANAGNVETPKGPPLARVSTSVPDVYVAQYSNVDVLELDVGSNTVMRRVSNGSVNATQILKTAGLDRSRRQKALDRDIGPRFEIIQGGTGKYQGTWVPLEDAIALARNYNVYDILKPLFEFDMARRPHLRPLTQHEMDERRRELAQQNSGQSGTPSASAVAAAAAAAAAVPHLSSQNSKSQQQDGQADRPSEESAAEQTQQKEAHQPSLEPSTLEPSSLEPSNLEPSRFANSSLAPPLDAKAESSISTAPDQPTDDLSTYPPLEPHEGDALAELSREVVTELFLSANRGETKPLGDILRAHGASNIEPDVPIDDAGHTALHWAAALGKVPLVADLVNHGANCRRGNRKGESPLVRAVLVTNSSDNQTFGDLLDLLFPCLHLGDAQGRTVLHHIALTAGIPGRSEASRYYLDALLEWAVRCRGASGVQWLVDELVDAQDANGDTALNIAARLGSRRIAQQLVEIGATVELPNRAGLKPADFGVVPLSEEKAAQAGQNEKTETRLISPALANSKLSSATEGKTHSRSGSRAPLDGGEKRQELGMQCSAALKQLEQTLGQELANKEITLQAVHGRLKEASENHDNLLKRKEGLEQLKQQYNRAQQQVSALEAAAQNEKQRFNAENGEQFSAASLNDTNFDADQPFRITDENELRNLPPILLRARIAAYKQNEQNLIKLRDELKSSSLDGEAKYRKVVAQCTSSDENKVDELLEDLLTAVLRGDRDKIGERMEVDT